MPLWTSYSYVVERGRVTPSLQPTERTDSFKLLSTQNFMMTRNMSALMSFSSFIIVSSNNVRQRRCVSAQLRVLNLIQLLVKSICSSRCGHCLHTKNQLLHPCLISRFSSLETFSRSAASLASSAPDTTRGGKKTKTPSYFAPAPLRQRAGLQ